MIEPHSGGRGMVAQGAEIAGSGAGSAPGRPRTAPPPQLAPSAIPPGTQRKRPRELEDGLNYWLYHPLAWRLALLLARTPLTPNMVSVLGAGFVVMAGVAYAQPGWPLPMLLGLALHMGWHVVDGADGDLARITGRSSPIGEMVDGLCDYLSHIVLYMILGYLLSAQIGGWAWVVMVAGGISHAVQANHVEAWRRAYQWWAYDVPWLRQSHDGSTETSRGPFAILVDGYLWLAGVLSAGMAEVDDALARTGDDRSARECLRIAALGEAPAILRPLRILGPNPRAIVLGVSMLAGSPLWYFLWQIVVLNLLLVRSVRRHEQIATRLLSRACC